MFDIGEIVEELAKQVEQNKLYQFEAYPWQDEFFEAGKDYNQRMLCAANRVGKCMGPNTIIETIDGQKYAKDLKVDDELVSYVDGDIRFCKVKQVTKKPAEPCVRLWLKDGTWIDCAKRHVVYHAGVWHFVQPLLESSAAPLLSIEESYPLGLLSNALRYLEKHEDFLFDYRAYRHLCDLQPHLGPDTDPSASPLHDDALRRIFASCNMDGRGDKHIDIPSLSLFRPSIQDASPHVLGQLSMSSDPALYISDQQYLLTRQAVQQLYLAEAFRLQSDVLDVSHKSLYEFPLESPVECLSNAIIGYSEIEDQDLYDPSLPESGNYFTGGILHHNTYSAGYEIALHATGEYPESWKGRRFEKRDMLIWAAGVTSEATRDIMQKELFGGVGELWGKGFIPRDFLPAKPKMRQAGIADVIDSVSFQNSRGGTTTIVLKSYEQGWRKFQGTAPDIVWLDEEPEDYKLFTECMTRLATTEGSMLVTFTPLLGVTELVEHFMSKKPGVFFKNVGWDDAPHLSEQMKEELLAAYPEWERDARTKGTPMMGEGRIFTVSQDTIMCDPFPIPRHFARIAGVDFGFNHPAAGAWIAWDRDNDVVYLYDCYKKAQQLSAYHAAAMNARPRWIPVAWPHDGFKTEPRSGTTLKQQYQEHGVNLLPISARYKKDTGGSQPTEPIVLEVLERMYTGRFRVFSTCQPFFDEFRMYHRKDGKIHDFKDDVLKATFYAIMMLRHAITEPSSSAPRGMPSRPMLSSRY